MNPYRVLGVPPGAPHSEIRSAYRRLARKYHPDLNNGDPKAAERMRQINRAWTTLSDPVSKAQADFWFSEPVNFGDDDPFKNDSYNDNEEDYARYDSFDDFNPYGQSYAYSQHNHYGSGESWSDIYGTSNSPWVTQATDTETYSQGSLPSWMRLGAPSALMFGVLCIILAFVTRLARVGLFGLWLIGLAALLFLISPFVVLVTSRHRREVRH